MNGKLATGAAYITGFAGFLAGLDWMRVAGIVGILGTLVTNVYFKWRNDRRAQKEHELAVAGALERRKPEQYQD
jgi:hypothetical protein